MTKLTKITLALALAIAASAVPAYVGSYAKSNPNFDCLPIVGRACVSSLDLAPRSDAAI